MRDSYNSLGQINPVWIGLGWISILFNLFCYGIGLVLIPIVVLTVTSNKAAQGNKFPRVMRALGIMFLIELPLIIWLTIKILHAIGA